MANGWSRTRPGNLPKRARGAPGEFFDAAGKVKGIGKTALESDFAERQAGGTNHPERVLGLDPPKSGGRAFALMFAIKLAQTGNGNSGPPGQLVSRFEFEWFVLEKLQRPSQGGVNGRNVAGKFGHLSGKMQQAGSGEQELGVVEMGPGDGWCREALPDQRMDRCWHGVRSAHFGKEPAFGWWQQGSVDLATRVYARFRVAKTVEEPPARLHQNTISGL